MKEIPFFSGNMYKFLDLSSVVSKRNHCLSYKNLTLSDGPKYIRNDLGQIIGISINYGDRILRVFDPLSPLQ